VSESTASPASRAVFLSYAREDSAAARRIADALRGLGVEVWFDQSELRGGDAWDQKIRKEIKDCAIFLPIVSAHTQERGEGYFRLEWKLAVERMHHMADGIPFLAPVALDRSHEADALVPPEFMRVHWTRLAEGTPTPEFLEQIKRLLEAPRKSTAIRKAESAGPQFSPPPVAPQRADILAAPLLPVHAPAAPQWVGLRVPAAAWSLAVLALVVIGGYFWTRKTESTPAALPDAGAGTRPPTTEKSAISSAKALATAADKSVAVLAFADLSAARDSEYFSDGISEELLNVLAKVPGLKVTARTSAFFFKGKNLPIPEIAAKLGVAYVIEGSVQRAGERVKITAQLIKAADGFHVWSETFTRDAKDVFAVEEEIAGLIAQNLQLKLGATAATRTVNPEAYALLLQGRAIFNRGIPDEYSKGIQFFKDSLAIEGGSALAWASLSVGYAVAAAQGMESVASGFALAREAANRALALDAELPQAHYALSLAYFLVDCDWQKAEASIQRALALAPNEVNSLGTAATIAQTLGEAERALGFARKAVELDPLAFSPAYSLAKSLFQLGRYAELEQHAERMIAVNPGGRFGYFFLTVAHLLQGRPAAAAQAFGPMKPDLFQLLCVALVRHAEGRRAESDAALAEMEAKFGAHGCYQIAEAYAYRNQPDRAFEWLEKAYRDRDPGLTWIGYDPFVKSLRPDARWAALVQRMKLPAASIK
jgi:TolB-like protein